MIKIRKFMAPEIVFGDGALQLLGQYSANFGSSSVLIVTDRGVIQTGLVDQVAGLLDDADIDYSVFSKVSANPRDHEIMAGAEHYHQHGCDVIVAVGGGSPMDCAKGISIVTTNKKNILEFEGVDNVDIPGPPLICIPTTAGSSADVSQFAIINNPQDQVKIAIISKAVLPDVALIDPRTTLTMDSYLTVCTGIDALVHAIEAYVSTAKSPIMDIHAVQAIRLIKENLFGVLQEPDNIDLRENIMLASLEAGLAFSNASLGAVHAMAHSLGGALDLPHGECNALLLEHVMRFNYTQAPERYDHIGEMFGADLKNHTAEVKCRLIAEAVGAFKEKAGILPGLASRGVKSADIAALAKKAMKDPCMVTNPRRPDVRDIEVLYEEAL